MWQIAMGLGLGYLYAGLGHLFVADKVAESIGWPVGSPFQREVGMWDAAMGIVALLCLKFRDTGFWTATILGIGIFSVAAGLGHVYEMVVTRGLFAEQCRAGDVHGPPLPGLPYRAALAAAPGKGVRKRTAGNCLKNVHGFSFFEGGRAVDLLNPQDSASPGYLPRIFVVFPIS